MKSFSSSACTSRISPGKYWQSQNTIPQSPIPNFNSTIAFSKCLTHHHSLWISNSSIHCRHF
jgi:hypothetical protein